MEKIFLIDFCLENYFHLFVYSNLKVIYFLQKLRKNLVNLIIFWEFETLIFLFLLFYLRYKKIRSVYLVNLQFLFYYLR